MAWLFMRTKEALKIFLPPPSHAYLKGHLFPLVAAIIKAQVINCFFVIINCEGSLPKKQELQQQQQQEAEDHLGSHTDAYQASEKEKVGGNELCSVTTFISRSWTVEMSSQG